MPVADPLLFPPHPICCRAVTHGDALDQFQRIPPVESIAFTQIWNAFPKGVARFHPGPEHKKDILDLRHKETKRSYLYGSSLSCGAAFGAITVNLSAVEGFWGTFWAYSPR